MTNEDELRMELGQAEKQLLPVLESSAVLSSKYYNFLRDRGIPQELAFNLVLQWHNAFMESLYGEEL